VFLAVLDGDVHKLCIFGFLGGGEDEGRVCCGILGLVFSNGCKVARVTDDGLR
jgi:hypothetical protein